MIKIAVREQRQKDRALIYADPPYLGTAINSSNGFKEQESADLFQTLTESGIRWAISEFDNPFFMDTACD